MRMTGLVARRARAQAGPLLLLLLLVATIAGVCAGTLGHARASSVAAIQQSLAAESGWRVQTRLAEDPAAQHAALEAALAERFPGVPLDVTRTVDDGAAGDTPFVTWTLSPVADDLTAEDLDVLAAGGRQLELVLGRYPGLAQRGLTVEGDLEVSAARVAEAASTAGSVALVPVVLLTVVSGIALVQVVRLLAQTRGSEVEILVARGAAPAQVTRWAALEGAALALTGAGLGVTVAAALVGRLEAGAAQLPVVWATGAVVAVAALLIIAAVPALQARALARRSVRDGRLRQGAALGTVVLTLVAAALSAGQLLRHGSPLVTGQDGRARVDVLAVAAPAAVLVALAVLALAALGPVTRAGQRLAAHRRGLTPALAARQVARRLRAYAVAVVLLVLAAGSVTTAGAFAGTAATQRQDVATLATGTDVRVDLPEPPAAGRYAGLEGVAAAASVLREPATVGDTEASLTALPTGRLKEVARVPEGLDLPVAALRTGGAARPTGITLPEGASHLELDVRVRATYPAETIAAAEQQDEADRRLAEASEGPSRVPDLGGHVDRLGEERHLSTAVWLADRDGVLVRRDAGTLTGQLLQAGAAEVGPEPTDHTVAVALPDDGGHRLAGIELTTEADWLLGYELVYEVTGVRARTPDGAHPAELPAEAWSPVDALSTEVSDVDPVGALGVRATVGAQRLGERRAGEAFVRLLPGRSGPVPAVVSAALAQRTDLSTGDRFEVALAGPEVAMQVAGVAHAVPGGLEDHAVLVDQAALGQQLLHQRRTPVGPSQVWMTTEPGADAATVAAAAAEVAGGRVEVSGATDVTAPVTAAFWAAAGGSVLLALTGVAAVALALVRQRRGEVVVLRALGHTPAGQARARTAELLGVSGLALALGVLAGWGTSVLLVPTLTRAAATTPTPLPLGPDLHPAPAALLLVALGAGLLTLAAVVAWRVRAQALDAEYREEIR